MFGHDNSPTAFPVTRSALSVGDRVSVQGRWWNGSDNAQKVRLCALEWTRRERDVQAVQQRAATKAATRKRGARRAGKAAMAGWVTCPICAVGEKPGSKRYFKLQHKKPTSFGIFD